MQEMDVLGVDIVQRVWHAVGMDETGQLGSRQRWSRQALMPCMAPRPPVLIGMEAWGGAHDWARRFRAPGHAGNLLAPPWVNPSVKAHNNASRDAEAMAEAVTRPPRRLVPTKDVDEPAIQALQRVRQRLRGARTALGHAVHGLLHADGIVSPNGVGTGRPAVGSPRAAEQAKRTPLIRRRSPPWPRRIPRVSV